MPSSTPSTSTFNFTPWNATRFFLPLCIQAMSQSLTYPLVGIVVSHGRGGAAEFSAFAQGLMMMFLIGTIGYGLVTTGMVFARDRIGYLRFARVNTLILFIEMALQVLLALPVVAPFVFGTLLGLAGEQLEVARWSMLCAMPAQIGFMLRNVPQVVLYNRHETAIANTATILRIILTAAIAPLFYLCGLVGWRWGCFCLSFPVFLEAGIMHLRARPFVAALPLKCRGEAKVTLARLFFFNIPLSLGGFLLIFAIFMLNAIINRAPEGPSMLAIHLVAVGLINPLSYGALRNQAVAIGFPQRSLRDQRTFLFALVSGLCLSLLLLPLLIPAVSAWYFCHIQNLQPAQLSLARHTLWVAMPFLVSQALRGHAEGLAAYRRRPNAVLAGQAVFFGVLVAVLVGLFHFRVPGYIMGITSLCFASVATLATIRLGLALDSLSPPLAEDNAPGEEAQNKRPKTPPAEA